MIKSNQKFCVYLTTYSGKLLPRFYVGSTFTENVKKYDYHGSPASEEWFDIWNKELKENPHLFRTKILSYHTTRKNAFTEEEKYQRRNNVVESELYANKAIANRKFNMFGKHLSLEHKQKISKFNKGKTIADITKKRNKKTVLKRYGVENISQLKSVKEKKKQTMIETFGSLEAMNAAKLEKTKKTNLQKIGAINVLSKNTPGYLKARKTIKSTYGTEQFFGSKYARKKIKETFIKKYGVDNISKVKVTCPHCNKTGKFGGMKNWHFDKCKLKI